MSELRNTLLPIFFAEADAAFGVLRDFFAGTDCEGARLEEAIRAVHTVKGAAALVGLEHISRLAAAMEEALDAKSLDAANCPQGLDEALMEGFALLQRLSAQASSAQSHSQQDRARSAELFASFSTWIRARLLSGATTTRIEPVGQGERPEYRSCHFQCRGKAYHVPIEDMVEIAEPSALTALPLAPPHVRGLMVHRGEAVPVVDLGLLGAQEATEPPRPSDWLVVAAAAGQRLAFLTEGVPSLDLECRGTAVDLGQFLHRYSVGAS